MNIQMSLYIVSIIIFPLALLIPLIKNNFNLALNREKKTIDDVFSKTETTTLKGISALIICFHHFSQYIEINELSKAINIYRYIGFIMVALFLFISGYTSYTSYINKARKGVKQTALIYKILKIHIPWLIVSVCFFYPTYVNLNHSILKTIRYILCFGLTIEDGYINASWFLIAICYLLTSFEISVFITKKFDNKNLLLPLLLILTFLWVAVCKLLGVGYWWYITIISYPFGTFVGINKKEIVKHIQKHNYLYICISVLLFALSFMLWLKQISLIVSWLVSITFCTLIFILCCKFVFKNRIFENMGTFSLEFFIIHVAMLDLLLFINNVNDIIFLLVLIVTYFLSMLLHYLDSRLMSVLLKK